MTQLYPARSNSANLGTKVGVTMALAMSICTPLQAQDTVVKGNVQRSDIVQQSVAYADLNLREQQSQLMLFSRVRKAANRVCDIVYRGQHPLAKFESRCTQRTYSDAKPQVDLAIANAQNGKQVAMSFTVARSR